MKSSPTRSVVLIIVLLTSTGVAMAFGKTFVLCSPFNGRALTQDGRPAGGITLVRSWNWAWNDETGSDSTVTDQDGHFRFPEVTAKSISAGFLPHEPDVRQIIIAKTDQGEVKIWSASKRSYDLNSELDGRPIKVNCYIDKKPSDDGLFWGTCVEDK